MNNNKLDIDSYTRKLINNSGLATPKINFTERVMGDILKNPEVNINFITKDDKQSNLWLFISIGIMMIGYFIFYFINNGFNILQSTTSAQISTYLKVFIDFFKDLFAELSLSPYIFFALIGVVILVILDKTIVKYLYSI